MQNKRELEQHIAVFGESGSGKTVMLSSFYGVTREPQFQQKSLFRIVADQPSQGTDLHQNYLGMKKSAQVPDSNRFSATSYSFSVRLKAVPDVKAAKTAPFDALRLVWHDYPGQWFEQDTSGPEEDQRKIATFRSLLGSDVAVLLVDGQRLLDNAGEEERYLKSLLTNFCNGLLLLKDDLLEDGKPLVEFPRIWILALSKSDLLPDMAVTDFRDLLVEKVGDDINELRKVLAEFVEGSAALSVGEDFLLLSSAQFQTNKIEVTKRVGLDLLLPIAAMLPFERHIKWAKTKQLPAKVAENLVGSVAGAAVVLVGLKIKLKLPGRLGQLVKLVTPLLTKEAFDQAARLVGDKLREVNAEARAREDYLTTTLTDFQIDLEKGEDEQVLLRSQQ